MHTVPQPVVLSLALPSGGRVHTTWTAPAGEPRGWAWVQHGFTRRGSDLVGVAGMLALAGFAVVRPDIASWRPRRSMHDTGWLTEVALTLGRAVEVGIPQARGIAAEGPWVLVGHSAGAAVLTHGAACLGARHGVAPVASLILLDPVDTVGGVLAAALESGPVASSVHVHAFRPSRCNRQGATVRLLEARGWPVTHHPGLSHPDPERIPPDAQAGSVPAAAPWLVRVCGEPGPAADVAELAQSVRAEALADSAL